MSSSDAPGIGHNGGPLLTDLDNLTEQDLLALGRKALLKDLVRKAESGDISHQEMGILRNLLRDNGMVFTPAVGEPAPASGQPTVDDLPDLPPPEYHGR